MQKNLGEVMPGQTIKCQPKELRKKFFLNLMNKNEEITQLAEEIMIDITNDRIPLHSILLKASRLSLLLDIPDNVTLFKNWAKYAEQNSFVVETFKSNIEAAQDKPISLASANPDQYLHAPWGNFLERDGIRKKAEQVIGYLANYRTETYNFALGIYNKWRFGNLAENIFEKKRKRTEPILQNIFPDINQRLNSIEQNLISDNSEDWKNAVVSCRALLMDLADILNPPSSKEDKNKYIKRLKDFISPKIDSSIKRKLVANVLEELKKRIEYTSDLTQGSAHKNRPIQLEAEDVVLYVYLIVSELMEVYGISKKKVGDGK